jgi:ubiquinone/menaquinone biosynthesis C-methylase UbiE
MGKCLMQIYDPVIAPLDWVGVRRWREWAVSAAQGRVLEVGIGTGLNLPHYRNAQAVAAIDPDGESLQRARARRNGTVIGLSQARAEALPFADESFDAVVGTLTFCSIGEPARALDEVRRVLKAGGALRLVEHVRVHNRWIAGIQDVITPVWRQIAGNCRLNRDTLAAVERAGFHVRRVHRLMGDLFIGIDAFK